MPLIALFAVVVLAMVYSVSPVPPYMENYSNLSFLDDTKNPDSSYNLLTKGSLVTYNAVNNAAKYVVPIFPSTSGDIANEVEDLGLDTQNSLCTTYGSKPIEMEAACSALTGKNCMNSSCCVYVNGNKCVAGSALGPTQLTDTKTDMMIPVDTYYYENKCYDGPTKTSTSSCASNTRNQNVCDMYGQTHSKNEWMCNIIEKYPTYYDCNNMPCCVNVTSAKGTQCKAGNKYGPFIKTDASGNALVAGKYSYKYQKTGYGKGY